MLVDRAAVAERGVAATNDSTAATHQVMAYWAADILGTVGLVDGVDAVQQAFLRLAPALLMRMLL